MGSGTEPVGNDELLGTTLGNFRIVRMLGRGGMGTVYLGEHTTIGSRVAMKFLHPHLAGDASLVERFFAEARAANLIGHDNIVSIIDLNRLGANRYYLVMEYLEGRPLGAMSVPLAEKVAVPILMQVCDALQAAHSAGVVHRDLKPENVFLINRGQNPNFVKLVDFGIAKLNEAAAGLTAAGLAIGTPEYMAPEQWVGEHLDGRADLYALGVIAYGLATGRLPFQETAPMAYFVAHREKQPQPPRQLNPSISAGLERVILKALSKEPDGRFRSALEMKSALQAVLERPVEPAGAARPPTPVSVARPQVSLSARVSWPGQQLARELRSMDLSRAGMYLCAEAPLPAMLERVEIALLHPEGELRCVGEVVRHVSAEQARAWGMEAGFAVQFVETPASFRLSIERLLAGKGPVETPRQMQLDDDPVAEPAIEALSRRCLSGDHYALLGAAADAECSEIRHLGRQLSQQLEGLCKRPLSARQRRQAEAALERVGTAVATLGAPSSRAVWDAGRGNFRGVARCLGAGLTAGELEALRGPFIAENPRQQARAQVQLARARAFTAAGDVPRALTALEGALAEDPMSLELHHAYWALKRRVTATPPRGSRE